VLRSGGLIRSIVRPVAPSKTNTDPGPVWDCATRRSGFPSPVKSALEMPQPNAPPPIGSGESMTCA